MDPRETYHELAARAATGDIRATLACAGYDVAGRGVAQSFERALERTRAAAEVDNPKATRILGAHALISSDVSMPHDRSLALLARAARMGDGIAAELLPLAESMGDHDCELVRPKIVCESPYIVFWPGFLSPIACAYLIAAARESLRPSDVIDSETGKQMESEVRISDTAWWQPWKMDIVLYHLFQKTVNAFGGCVILAEPTNVVRYRKGGKFFAHLDAYKNSETKQLDDSARATTSIVYLNEAYQGGETAFIQPKFKISGRTGDMLHFRNLTPAGDVDPKSVHAGMPILSGEKWVLVQWVRRGALD